MKTWKSILTIFVVWTAVAVAVTVRLHSEDPDGSGFLNLFMRGAPSWTLWALATPIIFFLADTFPLARGKAAESLIIQAFISALFILLYSFAISVLDGILSGTITDQGVLTRGFTQNVSGHWYFILMLYWVITAVAYLSKYLYSEIKTAKFSPFDNAILVKTRYGFVLVEIEKFQYVKGAGKKVMFHTGRSKHLNRQRIELKMGQLVEQQRYRPDRRIVIDLEKINKAEQTGSDTYVYHIGLSHELIFNQEMYMKLGGWLPTPVIT
jgi:hypothetical protein